MTTQERIESERPIDGVPIETESGYELALYLMPNGGKFATLIDGSEETWQMYCAELTAKSETERRKWRKGQLFGATITPQ